MHNNLNFVMLLLFYIFSPKKTLLIVKTPRHEFMYRLNAHAGYHFWSMCVEFHIFFIFFSVVVVLLDFLFFSVLRRKWIPFFVHSLGFFAHHHLLTNEISNQLNRKHRKKNEWMEYSRRKSRYYKWEIIFFIFIAFFLF